MLEPGDPPPLSGCVPGATEHVPHDAPGRGPRPGARGPGSLVLVGLPGVGKSTVGRAAAGRLGWGFVDFDEEIERREGASVAELFARRGEAYFRARERELTVELAGQGGLVLAPGGGWIVQPGLAALLRPGATIIYLAATPPAVAVRLGAGRAARPLLQGGDLVARLAALLAERAPHYRAADVVIDTELVDEIEVISAVCALATTPPAG